MSRTLYLFIVIVAKIFLTYKTVLPTLPFTTRKFLSLIIMVKQFSNSYIKYPHPQGKKIVPAVLADKFAFRARAKGDMITYGCVGNNNAGWMNGLLKIQAINHLT
jgi:hypothetical protein